MIRPRFFNLLVFILLFWIGSHFGHWNWSQFFLVFLGLMPLFSYLFACLERRTLSFHAAGLERYIERGEMARWTFQLKRKRGIQPLFMQAVFNSPEAPGDVRTEEFQLLGAKIFQMTLELPGRHIGEIQPRNFSLYITDPLGFFRLPVRHIQVEDFPLVAVLPLSLLSVREKDKSDQTIEESEHISDKSESEIDEIDRMRPMQPGDPMRSIHWKLSARMQSWMVRQYEKADEQQITFLIAPPSIDDIKRPDAEALLYRRDALLDRVSAAAQSFLTQDYSLRLKLRQPWIDINLYTHLNEYASLRIRLSHLPYQMDCGLYEQLTDEILLGENRFYCIFSDTLDTAIAERLLLLAASAQAVMLSLLEPREGLPQAWREEIRRLSLYGVKVYLHRMGRREG